MRKVPLDPYGSVLVMHRQSDWKRLESKHRFRSLSEQDISDPWAMCWESEKGPHEVNVFVSDDALKGSRRNFGVGPMVTLAHEAVHAALYVCRAANWEATAGHESEPFAYLTDFIVRHLARYYGVVSSRRRRR